MTDKRNGFISEISFTFVSQIIVTILNIVILKILSQAVTEEGMGVYLISRRFIALAYPVVTLNLSMSLARFISFEKDRAGTFLISSTLLLTVICAFLALILGVMQEYLSVVLFGSTDYSRLILPMLFFLYSNSFQVLCVSFFRGKQDFKMMNFLDILFWIGGTTALLFLIVTPDDFIQFMNLYFLVYGGLIFFINWLLVIRYGTLKMADFKPVTTYLNADFWKADRKFLGYGFSRIPSGFFMGMLFFAPILAASDFISLAAAAYVGMVVSIVRMIQILGFPFRSLFLPKISTLQANKDDHLIVKYSQIVVDFIFTLPMLLGLFCYLLAPELILLWFGEKYAVVIPYLKIVCPFVGLLLGYVVVQGILDGFADYPFVNIVTFSGMILTLIISAVAIVYYKDIQVLVIALAAGISLLGLSSIYILMLKQKVRIISGKNVAAILWFLLILFAFSYFDEWMGATSIVVALGLKLTTIAGCLLVSLGIYKLLAFEWIDELLTRLRLFN